MTFPTRLFTAIAAFTVSSLSRADTISYDTFFANLHQSVNAAVFPVGPRTLDDVESAFGPRQQSSTGLYDWHRGFDVDGEDKVDSVVAALDGYFYDYRFSSRGGYTVILEHHFADFTADDVTFQGANVTKFYTWHLHLWDDETANNGTSTDDLVSSYTEGDPISRGTQIGVLSNSGSSGGSPYAPHLHYEVRIGTNSSLEYQLDNVGSTTQWGFDPHVNPMLLFDAGSTTQTIALESGTLGSGDLTFELSLPDDYTIFNNLSVLIRDAGDLTEIASHELDLNLRTGFDATDVDDLDTQNNALPFIEPLNAPFDESVWSTHFVVPDQWLDGNYDQGYELVITATDIWGTSASTSLMLTAVPEPAHAGVALALAALFFSHSRRRRK
ncbi:MAG: hypothetical protein SynsKO_08180 [Synoicihabitans sp.]